MEIYDLNDRKVKIAVLKKFNEMEENTKLNELSLTKIIEQN